jgi:hypothetical protein
MSIGPEKITKLAERISATAPALAGGDEQGFRFIRPWRLNAGGTHEETKEVISCSECGCGISQTGNKPSASSPRLVERGERAQLYLQASMRPRKRPRTVDGRYRAGHWRGGCREGDSA